MKLNDFKNKVAREWASKNYLEIPPDRNPWGFVWENIGPDTMEELSTQAANLFADHSDISTEDLIEKIRMVFDPMDMRPEEIADHLMGWFHFKRKA